MIILKFMICNNLIQNFSLTMNNISYIEKVCYNIIMIDLIEKQKIKEFKIEIIKIIINLTDNHNQYYIEEFCNYEKIYLTIRLLENIRIFLESL